MVYKKFGVSILVLNRYYVAVRDRPYSAHAARGGGGSTKSVQKRAGGRGVFEALSAHAKSLQNGIVGLCWLVL